MKISQSVLEHVPNVLIEAMSVGTPCISTDIGDSARILGNCGWIVKSRLPVDLSKAIKLAINLRVDDIIKTE